MPKHSSRTKPVDHEFDYARTLTRENLSDRVVELLTNYTDLRCFVGMMICKEHCGTFEQYRDFVNTLQAEALALNSKLLSASEYPWSKKDA